MNDISELKRFYINKVFIPANHELSGEFVTELQASYDVVTSDESFVFIYYTANTFLIKIFHLIGKKTSINM